MFGSLTKKLQGLFSGLSGKRTLSEENISDAVRDIRMALLDADVNFAVANRFVDRIKEKSIGSAVTKSVSAGDQFTKIVHDELVQLMGGDESTLNLGNKASVLMLCGLQGSGKTATCAKLAKYIQKEHGHKKILLAACDLQRPAAIQQLKTLGKSIGVDVFSIDGETNPLEVAKKAQKENFDVLIVDTAGRLHLDDALMNELEGLKKLLDPQEVLFVANAATGQDAVRTALEFDRRVAVTGTILTMLDGSARAGAAISIFEVTGKPLKFEGIGEKVEDLQLFNPTSMADRILGRGDVINLVKKAEAHFDAEKSKEMEKKIRKASFTYDDYLQQMGMIKKMGSMKSLMKMMPGMGALGDLDVSDKQFAQMEAMILSMTPREREEQDELCHLRRKRLSKGSGVSIDDVNRMIKGFKRVKQLFKGMPGMGSKMPGLSDLKNIKNQMKGMKWR